MKDDILYKVELDKDICDTQGEIFRQAALDGCDMKVFTEKYLNSRFCIKQMETPYSSFQREDSFTCLEFIYKEIGDLTDTHKDPIYDPDIAYWIGYTYYQLYCETDIHGSELINIWSFNEMNVLYPGHHTMDEYYSVDDMCTGKQINVNKIYREYVDYLENSD